MSNCNQEITGICSNVLEDVFTCKILSEDEGHFHMKGAENPLECRIGTFESPNVIYEIILNSLKVSQQYCSTTNFILAPYFSKVRSADSVMCSVTAQIQMHIFQKFVILQLQQRQCLFETADMQDGTSLNRRQTLHQFL